MKYCIILRGAKIKNGEGCFHPNQINLFCCLLLTILVVIVYSQVPHFDFVHYDDHVYVTDNFRVKAGLTVDNIYWALTSLDAGFWQPLTWLSLMTDYELYGVNPGGYHTTNVIFHILNALLLFIVLGQMTGTLWRSFFVAALFAVHPLHVESVAWIAARKDVLSTFFLLLTLWGYLRYVQKPGTGRYFILVLLFIMGLMSKSMLVTLPFVLLLMDWWPLRRFDQEQPLFSQKNIGRLFLEKVPLLLMATGVSVVTIIAEGRAGALAPMVSYSLDVRIANALVSYVIYIGKMIYPVHLAVFYPHPGLWPIWVMTLSVLLLGAVTYFSIRFYKEYPFIAVGWFWYLGTLVPVIGLVQVGAHAMADRYTYIPLIGLFIALAWSAVEAFKRLPHYQVVLKVMAAAILSIFCIMSYVQTAHWADAVSLFRHALAVTEKNYIAHNNLGAALARQGNSATAIDHYKEALRIMPQYVEAQFNLGAAFADQRMWKQAADCYRRVLNIRPYFAEVHNNMGIVLARQGQLEAAIKHFQMALKIRNHYQDAHNNLLIAEQELQNRAKKVMTNTSANAVELGKCRKH